MICWEGGFERGSEYYRRRGLDVVSRQSEAATRLAHLGQAPADRGRVGRGGMRCV